MNKFLKSRAIIFILLLGAIFRFYGLNWDQSSHLHPDERMITMVTTGIHLPQTAQEWSTLLTAQSPLNPKFFPYGSFPIYLLKFSGWLFSSLDPRWTQYDWINLLGRGVSAAADLGAIFLIYLLGKNIWSARTGLWGALLYSLSVFPIQAAHFYAVDSLLGFFILATLYRLIRFYEKPIFKNALLVGICFGLSLATKVSATVLLAAIGAAFLADLFLILLKKIRRVKPAPKIYQQLRLFFPHLLKFGTIIIFFSVLTFLIFEPYALIDFPTFWRQTQEQQAMTKNAYVFPYTLQYVGTTPYLYHLKNLVLWGMGIPLGIISILATAYLIVRLIIEVPKPGRENQEAKILILVVFAIAYFLVVGRFAIKFMRYLLPLYPLLCLFSAWGLRSAIASRKKIISLAGKACLIIVLTSGFLWAVSFTSIYSQPNTRVLATEWINHNIPQGSKLAVEHWDDRVPMAGNYQFLEMPMYENDQSATKWQQVEKNLQQADYLILASNRLYVPLQKLADCQKYKVCYPKTAKYYQDLFAGRLGFQKIAEFTSYPRLELGTWKLEFADLSADESFTVYDHPRVIIFQKTKD